MGNNRRREVQDEKEKMEQSFIRTFGDGNGHIIFVRLWREACGKRRCRNHYGVFMEYKPV